MKINNDNTTIFCPMNDAESFTIIKIAKRLGFEVRVSTQNSWFCPLDKEPDYMFQDLKQNVIIIEMPGLNKEVELSKTHIVFVVDHHEYSSLGLNRENSKSSLEQFSKLINYKLDLDEIAIAINDQEYIYGLIEKKYSKEKINEIRKLDLLLQGYTEKERLVMREDSKTYKKTSNGVYIYRSSIVDKYSCIVDNHVMRLNGEISNIIIEGQSTKEKGRFIFFTGDVNLIRDLKKIGGYSKESNKKYGFWGGLEFGPEQVPIKKAKKIITNYLF